MKTLLLMNVDGKRAVMLCTRDLFSEPVHFTQYAILPGEAPEVSRRVPVCNWSIDGSAVKIECLDGNYEGELLTVEEPIQRPRGMKVWRDGEWRRA